MLKKSFWISLILICFAIISFAQAKLSSSASESKIGIQDVVKVTYTFQNCNAIEKFDRPVFTGFQIIGTSQSMNMGVSTSLTYVLQPTKVGHFTFPSINAVVDGQEHSFNPVSIEVVNGSLAKNKSKSPSREEDPFDQLNRAMSQMFDDDDMFERMRERQKMMEEMMQQGTNSYGRQQRLTNEQIKENIFVKVDVDKTNPYVGEQLTATYKLCTRLRFSTASISKLPVLNGFWSQDFNLPNTPKEKIENINGIPYHVFEIKKTALFPQQSGQLELDPARIECNTAYGKLTLTSPAVKINVKPLPTPQPENFAGAVGIFHIESKLQNPNITTDDMGQLQLSITGSGNLKLIQAPQLNDFHNIDIFDAESEDKLNTNQNLVSGTKIFSYPFSPQQPGDYDIPPVNFTYFDLQSKTYKTIVTAAQKLHVTEGANYKNTQEEQTLAHKEMHKNITAVPDFNANNKPVLEKIWYYSLYGIPFLSFLGLLAFHKRKENIQGNQLQYKFKRADKVAHKRVAAARKHIDATDRSLFYNEISKAIWLYLSDKFKIPLATLNKENISIILTEHKIEETMLIKINHLITECEISLYSPLEGKSQRITVLQEASNIISQLERHLS